MDGIEKELSGKVVVVRLNFHSSVGKEIADNYRVEFVPTFIYFDKEGKEGWRRGGEILSKGEFLAAIAQVE